MYTLIKSKIYKKAEKAYVQSIGADRLAKMEAELRASPRYSPARIVKIEGETNRYRYRIGGYRILYEVFDDHVEVLLIILAPRGDVYK